MIRAAPGLYPVREILPPDTLAAFFVLAGPYGFAEDELADGGALFLDRVDRVMRPTGYRLAGTFEPDSEIAAGVVGFRLIRSNALGDHLWIDDFVTGGVEAHVETVQLIIFLEREAKQLGLTQIHLDVFSDQPADDSDGDIPTGFPAAQGFDDLPMHSGSAIDREHAISHGFREWGGRFVLSMGTDKDSSSPRDQESPLARLRQLGRPQRPRR
jgi:hypothetical protein